MDPPRPRGRSRRHLAILAMVLLLGVLVLGSASAWARQSARLSRCGRNQAQLVAACLTYDSRELPDFWPSFPYPDEHRPAVTASDAHQARLVSVGIMATLSHLGDLPIDIFRCPARPRSGPARRFAPQAITVEAWGAAPGASAAYAIDWSVDVDALNRVLIADRDPRNHQGAVVVCAGDGHSAVRTGFQIDGERALPGMRTEADDGHPVPMTRAPQGEDLYAPAAGDIRVQLMQGGGDRDHAWVK